jgi:thiamine-monophosphate kinase
MGAKPRCFLLSLALPASATGKWLDGFLKGLSRAAKELGCELAGGDTTQRSEILISVTAVGEVPNGLAVQRTGARPGDQLFVTGSLGEAELGWRMLRRERGVARAKNAALRKHLYPVPRLKVAQWLAEKRLASAMMDLSDGLSTDLERLCVASGVGARIEARSLPVNSLARHGEGSKLALHGGDDYELLFAVKPEKVGKIPREYGGVALTRVGEITAGLRIMVDEDGMTRVLLSKGWDPFSNATANLETKRKR